MLHGRPYESTNSALVFSVNEHIELSSIGTYINGYAY